MNDKKKPAMESAGGRAFQVEERAGIKTLRQGKAWCRKRLVQK